MINAIIFDFDGTIANTKAFAYQVYSQIADKHSIKKLDEQSFDALKSQSLGDKLKAHKMSIFQLPRLARRARRAISHVMSEVEPFEGMIELLKSMNKKGIQLFIISSNSKKNIEIFLDKYQLDFFECVYGNAKYLKKEKVINKLLRKYKLNKDEVIYIGDETRDIISCKRIDMKVVSVTWGFDDKEMLESENPNFVAEFPKDIKKYVISNK